MKILMIAFFLATPAIAHAESDAWITTKAKLSLWTTGGVRSTEVHLDTNDGVVTLYGKVSTSETKQKAENISREVKGVTEVRNYLQVIPKALQNEVAANDKDIKKNVEKMLKEDKLLDDAKIRVKSVDNGVVLLSGKADTLFDHLSAIEDADNVMGVKSVKSEIEAPGEIAVSEVYEVYMSHDQKDKRAASSGLNDARISSAVKMRLFADGDTPSTQINVDTSRGHVTLFGMVETTKAKSAAEADAKKVSGVKSVKNDLQVVAAAKRDAVVANDDEIKTKTKELLGKHEEYKDVSVEVKNGVVRLTGTVPSSWDRMHVASLTRTTTGARSVHADVEVKK